MGAFFFGESKKGCVCVSFSVIFAVYSFPWGGCMGNKRGVEGAGL